MSPEYAICDCCGCESGNEDHTPESLDEYRQNWLASGTKWFQPKAKPADWNDDKTLKEQLERVKPKQRFHDTPEFSPFGSSVFNTPEAAITAGKNTDLLRKHELGLALERIKGKIARQFYWSTTQLSLEFDRDLYLVLTSTTDRINVAIRDKNIAEYDQWYEDYEFVFDDKTLWHWSPICGARYFTGKEFTNIQLEYRIVWLYFKKSPKLIEVMQCGAQESELPILTWQEGD